MPAFEASAPVPALRLMVTGFGSFPGVPRNPSAAALAALSRLRSAFARRGIQLTTVALPVRYDAAHAFAPEPVPDVIVHLGVASRRDRVSVETVARNHRSLRHPDASGRAPPTRRLGEHDRLHVDPGWQARLVAAELSRLGVRAAVSRDAGAYVCNATLYSSLQRGLPALFIHIPPARLYAPERIAAALARTLPNVVHRLVRSRAARVTSR